MKKQKLVMVGNGMAGVRTIEELIKHTPETYEIKIFGNEPHPNYNRIKLSNVLQGEATFSDIIMNELEWYEKNDIQLSTGDAVSKIDPEKQVVYTESGQNTLYVKIVAKSLLQTEQEMKESISNWTSQTAAHRVNSKTPLSDVAKNSGIFRRVYWEYIRKFIKETDLEITVDDLLGWEETINYTLDYVMETFTANFMEILLSRLNAQASLIMELSTPVIPLSKEIGLLPIIGDIDTTRAKYILESTLEQSVDLKLSHLIIDVSGVVMVDTMVAHQIFKIIDSLGLIGVEATLLGIRPEVAQTAVQLGVNFNKVRTENSLSKVLKKLNYHL